MTKQEFIKELSDKLGRLSKEEKSEYIEYYSEMIDDEIEDGLDEEDAVDAMGDIENIADKIMKNIPLKPDEKATYIEDHSIIDCTNRYRMNDGKFNFMIKVPDGTEWKDIIVEITKDYKGTHLFYTNLLYLNDCEDMDAYVKFSYAYDGFTYYELITEKFADDGIGIRLYLNYNGKYYMASDISNNSTIKGQSYWLGV